ncbi:DsbE family thiol:disulfide interchange protein [Pseudaestuariivita rosea]|uniref:DsbE family thiol:disulfide interchange protein n=1 Tax=Pseudaestuariivita rosea TaxID=2763263 RepID=UPI003013E9F6
MVKLVKFKFKPLVVTPPIIFVGFATLAMVAMMRDDPDALPSARIGQPAPEIDIAPLGEKAIFDDNVLRQDGIKLVNFWASWCTPCRVEHPNLMMLADEGFPIYGINYKEPNASDALRFLNDLGDPYAAVGTDITGRDTALDWGVYGIPETYVIDDDGTILLRIAGPVTQRVLDQQIRPAIAAARANQGP